MTNLEDFHEYKDKLIFLSDPLPDSLFSNEKEGQESVSCQDSKSIESYLSNKLSSDFYLPLLLIIFIILGKRKGLLFIPEDELSEAEITEKLNAEEIYNFLREVHDSDSELLDRLIKHYGKFNIQRHVIHFVKEKDGMEGFCNYMEAEYGSDEMKKFRLGINLSYIQYQIWKSHPFDIFNAEQFPTDSEFKNKLIVYWDNIISLSNDVTTAEIVSKMESLPDEFVRMPELVKIIISLELLIVTTNVIYPNLDGIEQLAIKRIKDRASKFQLNIYNENFINDYSGICDWFKVNHCYELPCPSVGEVSQLEMTPSASQIHETEAPNDQIKKLYEVFEIFIKKNNGLVSFIDGKGYHWDGEKGQFKYLIKLFNQKYYKHSEYIQWEKEYSKSITNFEDIHNNSAKKNRTPEHPHKANDINEAVDAVFA